MADGLKPPGSRDADLGEGHGAPKARPTGVTFIGHFPPPNNGHSKANDRLLNAFLARGVSVHVIQKDQGEGRSSLLHLLTLSAQVALLTRRQPQAVYLTLGSSRAGILRDAVLLSLTPRRRKIVVHLHGGYLQSLLSKLNWLMTWFVSWAFRRIDHGLVLCECLAGEFDSLIPRDRVRVVGNGLDTPSLSTQTTRPRGTASDLRVLFLSNSLPSKGLGVLIDAMVSAQTTHPEWTLAVYGSWLAEEGLSANEVEAAMRAKASPLGERVAFSHARNEAEVSVALGSADVLVLPTTYENEGQPLAIIEALISGLHVVATAHRCISSMFESGIDGVLIATPPSPDRLLEALETVSNMDPMTEERRQTHVRRWSIETMLAGVTEALGLHLDSNLM